jgi:hypothetical protein
MAVLGANIEDPIVRVRRHHGDWRTARYRLSKISDVRWDNLEDRTVRRRLHGYVWCDGMEDGEALHPCNKQTAPHLIRVSILKQDNPDVFEELLAKSIDEST